MTATSHAPDIIVAKHAGSCYGVERALAQVREAARTAVGPLYTLGPLIHNPLVVDQLTRDGAMPVGQVSDAAGATLVLRTHGVTPHEKRDAYQMCAQVIDATCPFVARAHRAAAELASDGYQVVVVGETGHPEVEGTMAHAGAAIAVSNACELKGLSLGSRVGVVVQTTQTRSCLCEVVAALVNLGSIRDLRVIDTICEATAERQRAARELAEHADVMIVIGGRNSANTAHLVQVCSGVCGRTHHIERPDELKKNWFDGAAVIGVTAGASTPHDQIDAVVEALAALSGSSQASFADDASVSA